jgi:hypothetical protein
MSPNTLPSLPKISKVEIVILSGDPKLLDKNPKVSAVLNDEQAEEIMTLWRQLPPGQQARCHIPPFGLRFFAKDYLICQASLCWECNNIIGYVESVRL